MASIFSHAVAALGIGAAFYRPGMPKRVWALGAACAIVPDSDVIGFYLGVDYQDVWGHRGFTHSLLFAALLAVMITALGFRNAGPSERRLWCLNYFIATASHGLLDAMTTADLGSRSSHLSIRRVTFYRGAPSWFRLLVSDGFSRRADLRSCKANWFGSGCLRHCWYS